MPKTCSQKSKNANKPNYICNPQSGIWVRRNGPTGKMLLGLSKAKSPKAKSPKITKSPKVKSPKIAKSPKVKSPKANSPQSPHSPRSPHSPDSPDSPYSPPRVAKFIKSPSSPKMLKLVEFEQLNGKCIMTPEEFKDIEGLSYLDGRTSGFSFEELWGNMSVASISHGEAGTLYKFGCATYANEDECEWYDQMLEDIHDARY